MSKPFKLRSGNTTPFKQMGSKEAAAGKSSPAKIFGMGLGKMIKGAARKFGQTGVGQVAGKIAGSGALGVGGMVASNMLGGQNPQRMGEAQGVGQAAAGQGGVPPHSHEEEGLNKLPKGGGGMVDFTTGAPIQRNDGQERHKSILGRETAKTPKRGAKRVVTSKKDKIKRKHWSGKTEKVKHKYKVIKNERGEKERVIVQKEKGGGKGRTKKHIRKGEGGKEYIQNIK